MTVHVAQACAERGIRLAYASTSEVYGDGASHTWEEEELGQTLPHNLYGLTKRWGEDACRLYAPEDLIIFRFSMPYGPGHPPGKGRAALTNFLWSAHTGQKFYVHQEAERAWCWIGDTVKAVRMVLESGQSGAWNVGRDDNSTPMIYVALDACRLVGASPTLIRVVPAPEMQTVVKRLSTQKLRALGWEPEVDLQEGMERTYNWLRESEWAVA
jgi:dTDP-glucose 4,6-dehydratase